MNQDKDQIEYDRSFFSRKQGCLLGQPTNSTEILLLLALILAD